MTDSRGGWVYPDVEDKSVWVYRASSFGNCTRSLVAARLGESAFPPNAGLRAAMEASGGLEDEIIRRFQIEMASDAVIWQQKKVELPIIEQGDTEDGGYRVVIRGHLDGMYQLDDSILEIKALGDANFEKYMDGGFDAMGFLGHKYRWQAAVYGHATERKVRMVVGRKVKLPVDFGEEHPDMLARNAIAVGPEWGIDQVDISPPMDPESLVPLADIHSRIAIIEEFAARDELPACDGGCREGDPYGEVHLFEYAQSVDDEAHDKMARFQEIKRILGSADKGTGLLGEKEDLSEWMKENLGVGQYTAGVYNARIDHVKGAERINTRRLKKERPDVAEEFTEIGMPTIKLIVTGGEDA